MDSVWNLDLDTRQEQMTDQMKNTTVWCGSLHMVEVVLLLAEEVGFLIVEACFLQLPKQCNGCRERHVDSLLSLQ